MSVLLVVMVVWSAQMLALVPLVILVKDQFSVEILVLLVLLPQLV